VAATNHWASLDLPGAPRWRLSAERQAAMDAVLRDVPDGLAWLAPPLLNAGTRLAATLRPAEGRLTLAAFEGERQVSKVLELN
ncbi:hypothetical protein, partial [Falsiroseomonas oryziterrae]|uniref:hypothetical protein n=1 Tax=Falsiroseomonas oryziterrae TaxID=2911368 RepID=UPI001F2FF1EA